MRLLPGRTYSYCIWARLGSGSSTSSLTTSLNMLLPLPDTLDPTPSGAHPAAAATAAMALSRTWSRACVADVRVVAPTTAYFSVSLGAAAATYHFDDAALLAQSCAS